MPNLLRWIRIHGILLLLATAVQADQAPAPTAPLDWPVTSSPARLVVELDRPDKPAPLTSVSLYLPDPRWISLPIRVFTAKGVAVGSDLLWAAPGEPATLLFDTSSDAKRYDIYFGSNLPAMHLQNSRNGVVLESRAGNGKSIDQLPDMLQAWNQSALINGRAMVEGLFEGGNRFGPQASLFEHFHGWFNVDKPEHLELATISNDASFVLVDGKEVVEWPGLHDFHGGLSGQHQGAVDLPAGLHALDYYNAYVMTKDENHPLLCCLAVNGGDLDQWTMLTPDKDFFLPTAHAHIVDYNLQADEPGGSTAGSAPPFAVVWSIQTQSVIAPDVPDLGFISLQFTCHPKPAGVATWSFDDGTTARGETVQHLFPRPGMRRLQLVVRDGDKVLGTLVQTLSVHPDWTKLTTFPPQLVDDHKTDIMARDPATFTTPDLASCVAVFGIFKNADGLLELLPTLCARMKEISDADLPYIKDAAVFLAHEDLLHPAEVSQLLTAVIDRCSPPAPSPELVAIGSSARLALAQLTLKTTDHTDQVKSLLAAIDVKTLTGEEHRSFELLRADLALATGDVAAARKQDEAMTGAPEGPDARSSIRRTAKIGHARVYMDRKDYEAAQDALNEVARRSPIEKLSPEWALTQLRLYQEENLTTPAYLWAKRLLPVITENGRSELLFRLTQLALAEKDQPLANQCLVELLKKHPYSQEAAEAQQKWPDSVPK